jgi:enoyl reductase-like protein
MVKCVLLLYSFGFSVRHKKLAYRLTSLLSQWEGTYDKPTGGIITVRSELGEPIHKVATRGVKLWREFDDKVFSLSREKQTAWLAENKDYVIKRLNADFQKVCDCSYVFFRNSPSIDSSFLPPSSHGSA